MSQPTTSTTSTTTRPRGRRKVEIGVVTSDKMNKTRRVELQRLVPHSKYGKYLKRRTICYAHDEQNQSHIGDLVEIMESRPLSKQKRWRLVRILRQGAQQALAGEGESSVRRRIKKEAEAQTSAEGEAGATAEEAPAEGEQPPSTEKES